MSSFYNDIIKAKSEGRKLLAVLLDPDKLTTNDVPNICKRLNHTPVTHIFVGGSLVTDKQTDVIVKTLKQHTKLPLFLFPGNTNQLTNCADALLFLSLLSGDNPEFLIHQHIKSVPFLKTSNLEIIPTGYILIDGDIETAVQRVSQTTPIPQTDLCKIANTALAGEFMGKHLIYLEAGSGAKTAINATIISEVANNLSIPLIIGGGIRTVAAIKNTYNAGADIVVIGTAFENDVTFFDSL